MFSRTFARWFPVPRLLVPCATGVDITDSSVKWLSLKEEKGGTRIAKYGTEKIGDGVVRMGAIQDVHALASVLHDLKKKNGISCAHAALPEEGAYVFSMHVPPGSSREQILHMIEFELENRVPIPPSQAVYDYDTVAARGENGEEIAVTVFPRDLADGYVEAFAAAGIDLVSLEIEARSIARAISGKHADPVTLLVDCGYARTGVAILKNGIPIFTSTVDIGGYHMSRALMEALQIQEDAAVEFKNEHGLIRAGPEDEKGYAAIEKIAAQLGEEIAKHYRFWDTRRAEGQEKTSPVERVYLLGGSANLKGLPEYIAGKVHVPAERPNVWRNIFSFDDYIPPIEYRASFQYATAIGLALRSL